MKKLFMILCATALIFGCSDDKTDGGGSQTNATLSISAEQMAFSVGGDVIEGENAITVTSSSAWRLLGDKTWCTPSVTEGASGGKVTFTAAPNTATEPRSVTYTFVCGDKAMKMVVTQKQSAVLDLMSGSTVEVGAGAGLFTIRAVANKDVSYEIPAKSQSWITPQEGGSRAAEGIFLSFNVKANETYDERIGAVVLKVDGKETAVEIKQKQFDAMVMTKDLYEAPIGGGQVAVAFETNVDYKVVIDRTYDWITTQPSRGLVPGQVVFNVAAGTGTRIGQIKFTTTGGQLLTTASVVQYGLNRVYADIPDANFRSWLKSNDFIIEPKTGVNCELTGKGIEAETFNCSNRSIASFEGIEAFKKLTSFDCSGNTMTSLDLSGMSKLKTFTCKSVTALTSLTLNAALESVNVTTTYKLTSVDFSKCINLKNLTFGSNTLVTSIDLSKCTALTSLTCNSNLALTSLDLSNCTSLASLTFGSNSVLQSTKLNNALLTTVTCTANAILPTLDFSKCPALKSINVGSNPKLETLNITNCAALETMTVTANALLTAMNLSGNTTVKTANFSGSTTMLSINVSNTTALTSLTFTGSGVKTLNTTDATALKEILCSGSPVLSFDLSTNLELNKLSAYNTKITTLDISKNTKMTYLDCDTNPQLLTLYLFKGQKANLRTFYKDAGLQIIEVE